MNRNQITMAAIGGVAAAATLTVGFFAFTALGESGERSDELEGKRSSVQSLKREAVAPCEESVRKIDANRDVVAAWRAKAFELASQGDALPETGLTPAAFKQRMVDDARDLARLPGGVGGMIAKPESDFGFKEIVRGGAMPKESELPALQRQWTEISSFVRTLSQCGAQELVGISAVQQKKDDAPAKPGARRPAKKAAQEKEVASSQRYRLVFRASPAAFVRVLNAFAASPRFTAVESFDFRRVDDRLAGVLGGGRKDKAEDEQSRGGRGGRGGRGRRPEQGEQEKEPAEKKGLVTDPASVSLVATLDIATYDFGTAAAKAAEAAKGGKEDAQ